MIMIGATRCHLQSRELIDLFLSFLCFSFQSWLCDWPPFRRSPTRPAPSTPLLVSTTYPIYAHTYVSIYPFFISVLFSQNPRASPASLKVDLSHVPNPLLSAKNGGRGMETPEQRQVRQVHEDPQPLSRLPVRARFRILVKVPLLALLSGFHTSPRFMAKWRALEHVRNEHRQLGEGRGGVCSAASCRESAEGMTKRPSRP